VIPAGIAAGASVILAAAFVVEDTVGGTGGAPVGTVQAAWSTPPEAVQLGLEGRISHRWIAWLK
jgi:hypothetical protein